MEDKWISPIANEGIYEINTGKWRTFKPVIDYEKCTTCAICAFYCPVTAVKLSKANNQLFIDLDYCKGCGICAVECPRKAIEMVREEED
mgnify:CR=1 FL=1